MGNTGLSPNNTRYELGERVVHQDLSMNFLNSCTFAVWHGRPFSYPIPASGLITIRKWYLDGFRTADMMCKNKTFMPTRTFHGILYFMCGL